MGERYNESADTFSFGLVLLCLATGDIDYIRRKRDKYFSPTSYAGGFRPPIPDELETGIPQLAKLIKSCWADNPRMRPAMRDVVEILSCIEIKPLDLSKSTSL